MTKEKCIKCGKNLELSYGPFYGYKNDTKVEFVVLPRYTCFSCNKLYMDRKIAVLANEIIKKIDSIKEKVVVNNKYEFAVSYSDKSYDVVVEILKIDNNEILVAIEINDDDFYFINYINKLNIIKMTRIGK